MKKTTLIFATMIAAMVTLTACGGNKAETTGKENRTPEITEEREDSKTEKTKEDKNSKIKTVSEDEIVVRVGDVEIPITSTWGDLMTIASEQGWAIDTSLIPDEEAQKFSKKGTIQTPQGELLVSLMANADKTAAEIEYIALSPFYMDSDDADILGIKPGTSLKKVGKTFELIEEDGDNYFYKVDEFVTLKISLDTYEDKNTVNIIRTKYYNREE